MAESAHAMPAAAPLSRVLTVQGGVARLQARQAWAVIVLALIAAAGAVAVSLSAGFLRYPGWLAAQRADLILGPVIVGLYWWKRRPSSRFGPLLVAFGFLSFGLVLQGARQPLLYSIGVLWDAPFLLATLIVILLFPAGVVRGLSDRAIPAVAVALMLTTQTSYFLFSKQIAGGGPIAGCRAACPDNVFFVTAHPRYIAFLFPASDYAYSILVLGTAAVLVGRFLRGSPPRRRALAIGNGAGLVFLLAFAAYHLGLRAGIAVVPLQWTLVAARSLLAWGFLAALLYSEIVAGRVLRATVAQSLGHPAIADLERSLRIAIGDPQLRLGFRVPSGRLVDSEGRDLETPPAGSSRRLTEIAGHPAPAAAIDHDEQLEDDPELLLAASAAALLMFENASLEAELGSAVRELRSSRARLVETGDLERQRFERELHTGVQQQLLALRIKVELAHELARADTPLHQRLEQLRADIDDALSGVSQLAHELFPPLLTDLGLAAALRNAAARSLVPVRVECPAFECRHPIGLEAALYYCCVEALRNAEEHAGPLVRVTIAISAADGELAFSVHDDGRGFDPSATPDGTGFANMRDRLGAFGGALVIEAARGRGTLVCGSLPLAHADRSPTLSERKSNVAVTRRFTSDSSGRSNLEKIEPM